MRIVTRASAACVFLMVAAAAHAQDQLCAEEFRSEITVLQDGSIAVDESIRFRFSGKTFREVTRTIPLRRTDGAIAIEAFVDGQKVPDGRDAGEASIRARRRDLRVIWRFPRETDVSRTFGLSFRAMGALRLERERISLAWHVLPSRHAYAIDEAILIFRTPEGTRSLDSPALESTGWQWTRRDDGAWEARKQNLVKDETALLTDTFAPRGFAMSQPAWQALEERTRELSPAFVVGAAVIVVMGLGVVVMVLARYHRPKIDQAVVTPADRRALPVAMGTALRWQSPHIHQSQMSAAVFDLLSRSVLRIIETSPSGVKDSQRTFDFVIPDRGGPDVARLRPHEQAIVDALWLDAKQGRVDLKTAQRALRKAVSPFTKALRQEIDAAGYLDRERVGAGRGLIVAGVLCLVAGLAGAALLAMFQARFGELAPIVGVALMVTGGIFLIAGSTFPVLSATGVVVSAQWVARAKALKALGKRGPSQEEVDEWLPVAIGLGQGHAWAKSGVAVSWLAGGLNPAVILPILLVTSSGGGVPGGVGGGGFSGAR